MIRVANETISREFSRVINPRASFREAPVNNTNERRTRIEEPNLNQETDFHERIPMTVAEQITE